MAADECEETKDVEREPNEISIEDAHDVDRAREDLHFAIAKWLTSRGWRHTSEVACVWLWQGQVDGKTVYVDEGTAVLVERLR
jgi:hypothetical protein